MDENQNAQEKGIDEEKWKKEAIRNGRRQK